MLIERKQLRAQVANLLEQFRGVLLIGPRQVGKTTLARTFVAAGNPKSGASWEGFALEQVLRLAQPDDAYFWAPTPAPSSTC